MSANRLRREPATGVRKSVAERHIDQASRLRQFTSGRAIATSKAPSASTLLTSVLWYLVRLVTAVANFGYGQELDRKGLELRLAKGSVKLADFHGLDGSLSADVKKKADDKFETIKSGAFEVPHDASMVRQAHLERVSDGMASDAFTSRSGSELAPGVSHVYPSRNLRLQRPQIAVVDAKLLQHRDRLKQVLRHRPTKPTGGSEDVCQLIIT